jgi:hypothetical protein
LVYGGYYGTVGGIMIISILLALIFCVLMFIIVDLKSKIECAALMIISEIAVWGTYILNALEK